MSGLLDMLTAQLDSRAVGQLSNQLGADSGSLATAIQAALPMMLGALERNTRSEGGAAALHNALSHDHDDGILNDMTGFFGQAPTEREIHVVDDIFGGRRQATERAIGQASGLDAGTVGGLLSNLAPVLMSALGQHTRQSQLGTNDLSSFLGQETQQMASQQPGVMGIVNQFLDTDGDGDLDISDIVRHGTGFLQRFLRR